MHISIVLMSVLRVLWMSTHGCFAILFPHTRYLRPDDDGAQEPDAATADCYYQEGPDDTYYWIEPADQD